MSNHNDEKLAQAVRDTGGPAYPWGEHGVRLGGMNIRDVFAKDAMNGMLSDAKSLPPDTLISGVAELAYKIADSMLAERATTEKPPIPQPQGMPR